jgi:hypothetical protein
LVLPRRFCQSYQERQHLLEPLVLGQQRAPCKALLPQAQVIAERRLIWVRQLAVFSLPLVPPIVLLALECVRPLLLAL